MPTLDSLAHLDGYGLLVARCLLSLVFAASAYDKFRAPPEELAMLGRLHLPFPGAGRARNWGFRGPRGDFADLRPLRATDVAAAWLVSMYCNRRGRALLVRARPKAIS